MEVFEPGKHPHRRFNPITGEWMLVSPHRTQRPWQGQRESPTGDDRPAYDPKCYLCPGNERAGGSKNPPYENNLVFNNDYSALLKDTPLSGGISDGLLQSEPVGGECRVICFSPRHDLTLPEMPTEQIRRVVNIWSDQITELGAKYTWVQLFENKGAAMGCSNPHPHGQVWAGNFIPMLPAREDFQQKTYAEKHSTNLLLDYLGQELQTGIRVVEQNEHWAMLVPFWAVWPYEYLLLPRRHVTRMPELTDDERNSLAEILKASLIRYDNLFETSFPYSMGWHGAPTDGEDHPAWQLHAHFFPPLLRGADVRKFMVGYEMMAEPQRDITAEDAAKSLKALSTVHYKTTE